MLAAIVKPTDVCYIKAPPSTCSLADTLPCCAVQCISHLRADAQVLEDLLGHSSLQDTHKELQRQSRGHGGCPVYTYAVLRSKRFAGQQNGVSFVSEPPLNFCSEPLLPNNYTAPKNISSPTICYLNTFNNSFYQLPTS